jgi:hypothetical protein
MSDRLGSAPRPGGDPYRYEGTAPRPGAPRPGGGYGEQNVKEDPFGSPRRTYTSITTRFHSANANAPMDKRTDRLNQLAGQGWVLVTSASSADGAWTTIVDTLRNGNAGQFIQ